MNLANLLIGVPTTLLALTVHEFAHGYVSSKLGDPTPKFEGRLTLNPLAHLDLVGTLLMIFTGFGWAKPVMINPRYYKDQTKGMALTALAGPLANLILAFLGVVIWYIIARVCVAMGNVGSLNMLTDIMYYFAGRNLCFAVFNIIPIPPLDGFKIAGVLFPKKFYYTVLRYERYSILLIMLLSLTGAFDLIIGTGVYGLLNLMIRLVTLF